jgi:hypothetical protein
MPDLLINSDPYSYSTNGVNYSGLMAASKIIDDIRRKNNKLADELITKDVTPAYLQQILIKMSPSSPKISFHFPPKEAGATGTIPTLDELIALNFYKRQTQEVAGVFTVYSDGKPVSVDIGMITLRALEAVFRTTGRTFFEMEALKYVQTHLLRSISAIRYKHELLKFLLDLPRENETVNAIVDRLVGLCETAQNH